VVASNVLAGGAFRPQPFEEPMKLPQPLTRTAAVLALAATAWSQAYHGDIDAPSSVITFSGSTNFGPIVGTPDTFQLDGTLGFDIQLDCAGMTAAGELEGGDAITIPATLSGHIPNPIPIFPPLASLTVNNLHASASSPVFAVAPDGTFTALVTLTVLSGSVDYVPLIGAPGTLDIAGLGSDPGSSAGMLTVGASSVQMALALDLLIPIDDPDAGLTGSIHFTGTIHAAAPRVATFCDASDGALASCPCAPGDPDTGCELPQGTGGVGLTVLAQRSAPANSATLQGCGFPVMGTPTALVIRAGALEPAPVVFGDGLRCIGVPLVRLAPAFATNGVSQHVVGHGTAAGAGQFHYQLWLRSTPQTFCDPAAAFTLSNGISLSWP
jgi:hypothetical protein